LANPNTPGPKYISNSGDFKPSFTMDRAVQAFDFLFRFCGLGACIWFGRVDSPPEKDNLDQKLTAAKGLQEAFAETQGGFMNAT